MELTQRLECTQTLYGNQTEKISPDQVAFLGICGDKYPVVKGPNKIGRDPDTCNIVLKLNSISRQHAVINVLNNSEYMLMDLDSANKTKLENKMLQPYIPYPIRNGDTVQFGQVFGIFRLLEEDNNLPMTQAIDIPETPVVNRHKSKFNNVHITTVPESPDVSDKDDSFIMPSQPKVKETFRSPNNNIAKLPGNTLSVPKIVPKKIDNVYWNSSRKSESLNLQMNTMIGSLDGSLTFKASQSKVCNSSIHEVNTQIPNDFENNDSTDSLFAAETQLPENRKSINIYNMETQVSATDNTPEDCKIQDQLSLNNKDNDKSIFDIETQASNVDKTSLTNIKKDGNIINENTKHDTSDEVIVFNEIDSQPFEEIFESQALLLPEVHLADKENLIPNNNDCATTESSLRNVRLKSDSSTDCEDDEIRLSQNVFEKQCDDNDDDVTDCEDIPNCQEQIQKSKIDEDLTDCEDELFVDIPHDNKTKDEGKGCTNFEDLPTQIIADDPIPNTSKDENVEPFEDMLTQVIDKNDEEIVPFQPDPNKIEDMLTQVIIQNENKQADKPTQFPTNPSVTPFKVPQSPLRIKRDQKVSPKQTTEVLTSIAHDEVYYASTQEVFDDLCSQKEVPLNEPKLHDTDNENHQRDLSDKRPIDIKEKLNENFANVSNNKINKCNVLDVAKPKKFGSGDSSSDVEITPKKVSHLTFMEIDLPNSQEIKSSVSLNPRNNIVELSSGSETENDSEQSTPILFHHKKKKSNDAKMNLSKKFEINALPTRIITRVRKPTSKALNNADTSSNICKNILKPKFLTDQEENIDKEIITENITRLKTNACKSNEKSIKKDTIHTDKKTKSDKEVKEKKNKKSTDKKTSKSNDNNKGGVNTIDEYLTNSNLNKSVATSRNTRSRSRRKADTDKKSTSPEKIIKTRSSKSVEKQNEKETTLSEKVDKIKTSKSYKKENENKSILPEKANKTKIGKLYEKDNEKKSILSEKADRTKCNKSCEKSNEKKLILSENADKMKDDKSYEKHKKDKIESISEQSVRRSRRRKDKDQRNSIQNEKSTVYNMSSESSLDSSNAIKRSAESYQLPIAKKAKTSSEMHPSKYTVDIQYVLFTAFPNEEVKSKLESLGAVIVNDVMSCTMVLTLQIKRTFKLLCAVGLGRPIVGPPWVQACVDAKCIVDPQQYIIYDEETEKRFQFDLKKTLRGRRNFLRGYRVSCTPKVMPNAQEMKMIVECSGGTFKEGGRNWLCVSCPADKPLWPQYKRKGAIVVSTELILAGVLQQRLDIESNRLV